MGKYLLNKETSAISLDLDVFFCEFEQVFPHKLKWLLAFA